MIRKRKTIEKVESIKKSVLKQNEFFLDIWKERYPHNCYECNCFLGGEPKTYMFDHILEKNITKYKTLCYNK